MFKRLFIAALICLFAGTGYADLWSSSGKAARVKVSTGNFNGNLGANDDTVQKALETLDQVAGTGETTESVQDKAWLTVSGGTQALITVTYQDATDDVDFVVNSDLHSYSWTNVVDLDIPNAISIDQTTGGTFIVDQATDCS